MPSRSVRLPPDLIQLVQEFHRAYGRHATVWVRADGGWIVGATTRSAVEDSPPADAVPVPERAGVETAIHVETDGGGEDAHSRFLAHVVLRQLEHEEESRSFGKEIGECYEEITLLYTISEILGSVISLEEAATTILGEVAGTLAVRRASLWLYDPEIDRLELVAAHGPSGAEGPIDVEDERTIAAAVFHDRRPLNLEPGEPAERFRGIPEVHARASLLSVPVIYSPPDGEVRTIGAINLVGRDEKHRFDAGNQKMMMAIASQIGAAVENSRLVEASLQQERMEREMELAHDLQMKLLPQVDQFDGYAEVAARCVPAQSVGGDFYHLFRLPGGRLGVMIGDVSSHGFGAALIMALTMSAVAIHASEGDSPSEVLRRTHRTLIDELETTEMYLTLFYGVIDPGQGRLTFANAGHSAAFRVLQSGEQIRLGATNPPLGIVDLDTYGEETVPWNSADDLLLLFTDGLSDALELGEVRGQQAILDEVVAHRSRPVAEILDHLYALPPAEAASGDDRTAVLVRF